ncbi:hypothetical protein AKJ43_02535 [candidate division MSBL1 archaeon SCGC-AAA261D19]|uniref:SbsA Ig-like domain-containing protein n=1 Tax=candidate division MSBL1 archaeon SCGC-AAA261D19 TaxID=1698273 RepID=A0A133V6I6_9EURY|nr:hypothetical protein AKJ43_02535 [candidate division MSBL1 archaeon SCGC-AAA261D19]
MEESGTRKTNMSTMLFDAKDNIMVEFSEAMNKTASQKAFSITPSALGEFKWIENTLIFSPSEPLEFETQYEVRVTTQAMDLAWNRLEDNYSWTLTINGSSEGDFSYQPLEP